MNTKTVKRYYCDHCKKGGQSARCILRHETTCIRNPLRVCPACSEEHLSGALLPTKESVETLMEAFRSGGLSELRAKADGCPACMLSAIVQSRPNGKYSAEVEWVDFNYKEEMQAWENARRPVMNF